VRYSNGGVAISDEDLSAPNGGFFGQQRYYSNQTSSDFDGPVGFNWFSRQMPYACASGTSVAIVFDPNSPYWFDLSGSTYVPRYGTVDVTLVDDTTAHTFTFTKATDTAMELTVFNDFGAGTAPGGFVSYTDPRGVTTTVSSRTGIQINELQRSYGVSGVTTNELLDYSYYSSGDPAGKLQYVTFSRQVGGGSPTQLSRAAYTYYGSSDTQGSNHDLQSASEQIPDGSGGWNTTAVMWYRYWMTGSSTGYAHALKMRFGPEAYRLMLNASVDVTTASDSTVLPYADQYFEYNPSTRQVTKEIAAASAGGMGNGTASDTFAYSTNSNTPPTSPPDYNWWAVKTTQTLPDSSTIIVYTNFAGIPMLYVSVDSSGSNKWITFYRYDSNGRLIWQAQPSAVTGYDDTQNDLLNYNTGTGLYAYLKNSSGLIKITDYYSSTNISLGQVAGYVSDVGIQQGQSGSPILTCSYTYSSNADSSGNTVYPVAEVIDYPIAGNTTTQITTSYSYTWYSGTNIVSQKTTTRPAVTSGQNGSGTAATIVEQFDAYGNLTQRTDERGIVSTFTNDIVLGGVTEQVLNYQSGVTQPGVNVTSDFTYDSFGRLTQELGPSHTAVIGGTATTVRPATWYVLVQSVQPGSGTWIPDENRVGYGYATGTSPSYTYTLINPVTLNRQDKDGSPTDQIASRRTTGSGALSSTDTFSQSDWQSWTSFTYSTQHQLSSQQAYFLIPTSGAGTAGTNFGQSVYGYDALERQNRVVSPGGTITRTVWSAPQFPVSVWVGTNDTGATDSNPAGSGSPNNMVIVTANQFDSGSAGGNGNLTQVTQYASATDTRVTSYVYDFRDRQISCTGEINVYFAYTYDNFGQLTQTDRRNTNGSGNLIGRSATAYDNLGQVYQQTTYAVDPSTGTVGNALTTNNFYDAGGNLIMQIKAGDGQVFSKFAYNGAGWLSASYRGYNLSGSGYSEATSLTNDTILEQILNTFDEVGDVISQSSYQRLNDATGTGPLSTGTQPEGRASYTATWFDGINRPIAAGNYGAASSFTRPTTPPSSSGSVLVTNTTYNDAGLVYQVTDPLGLVTQTAYDNAGHKTQLIEAVSGSTGDDLNRTTNWTYTTDNLVATVQAINGRTGNQTTTYTYGTTTSTSGVARNDLLASVTYPDSVSGSDVVGYTYNGLGQQVMIADQRGSVRTLLYDKLGRRTDDCVTTAGTGVDATVLRISESYEVRGMPATVTSYNNATPGSGTAVNEVAFTYNTFSQLVEEQQEWSGAVTGSTLSVQYGYDTGGSGSNEIRQTSLSYPSSRVINYVYGSGMDSALNRITSIQDNSTSVNLATYTYLGLNTVIRVDYSQPQVRLDLWGGTSGTFNGLDLFNNVIDQRWLSYSTSADLDRYQYGYDQDSNCSWRANTVGSSLDEFYTYDHLNRLSQMQRGTLNSTKTGLTGTPLREMDYTLDPTENWRIYLTKTSGTTDLNQGRTSSTVNEITAVSTSGGLPLWTTPAYDAAGNMTTMPQVATPTSSYTNVYDAWNRIVSVSTTRLLTTFAYDGLGRRILDSGRISRRFYFSNQWQAIEEWAWAISVWSMNCQYAWGVRYVDDLICRDDYLGNRLYAMQDANFNVTSICNASGTVDERYLYDPYGLRIFMNASWTVISASAYTWTIGQRGLWQGTASGLIYARQRMIHPLLGVFIARHPTCCENGMNLYEVRSGSPAAFVQERE